MTHDTCAHLAFPARVTFLAVWTPGHGNDPLAGTVPGAAGLEAREACCFVVSGLLASWVPCRGPPAGGGGPAVAGGRVQARPASCCVFTAPAGSPLVPGARCGRWRILPRGWRGPPSLPLVLLGLSCALTQLSSVSAQTPKSLGVVFGCKMRGLGSMKSHVSLQNSLTNDPGTWPFP